MTPAKELLDTATPLPWTVEDVAQYAVVKGAGGQSVSALIAPADAALIVYAVNTLPASEAAVGALYAIKNSTETDLAEFARFAETTAREALRRSTGADPMTLTGSEKFAPGTACPDCGAILHGYPCVHHNDGCSFFATRGQPIDAERLGRDAADWHRYLHQEGILVQDEGEECGPWHHRVFTARLSGEEQAP